MSFQKLYQIKKKGSPFYITTMTDKQLFFKKKLF